MKRFIVFISLYSIISSILYIEEPNQEISYTIPNIESTYEILNNSIEPSFSISDEKKN